MAQGAAVSRTATPADVLSGAARWCVVEGDALAVVTRRVREAVAQRVAPKADGVVTDARSWGLW